jgi:hypothetical protein
MESNKNFKKRAEARSGLSWERIPGAPIEWVLDHCIEIRNRNWFLISDSDSEKGNGWYKVRR